MVFIGVVIQSMLTDPLVRKPGLSVSGDQLISRSIPVSLAIGPGPFLLAGLVIEIWIVLRLDPAEEEHPSMPTQIRHYHSQDRRPGYAIPKKGPDKKGAGPASDAVKEVPHAAACQNKKK